MSIDLPRSARDLHFTGSVKALAPERPANALGQERPRAPAPVPPTRAVPQGLAPANGPIPAPPPKPARSPDVYMIESLPTPFVGGRPSERLEAAERLQGATATDNSKNSKKLTTMRGQYASIDMDEDILTQAPDRDEIDAALFPVAKRENASSPPPNLPVPHFRSAAAAQKHHAEPTIKVPRQSAGGSLPLGAWLFAALIAGVISYQLAPSAVETVSQAVRALVSS